MKVKHDYLSERELFIHHNNAKPYQYSFYDSLRALSYLIALAGILLLNGCSVLGSSKGVTYYTLDPSYAGISTETLNAEIPYISYLDRTTNSFLNSSRMLYRTSDAEMRGYRYSAWVDTPAKYLARAVTRELARRRSSETNTSHPEKLECALEEFIHDFKVPPGEIIGAVRCTLSQNTGQALGSKLFISHQPVMSAEADAAVAGFSAATIDLAGQIVEWILNYP